MKQENLLITGKWMSLIFGSCWLVYKLLDTKLGFNIETLFASLVAFGLVGFVGTIAEDESFCNDMTFPKIVLLIVELMFIIFLLGGVFSGLTI